MTRSFFSDTVKIFLDSIIRIRAIQDFKPSEAVAFVFLLQTIIRQELGKELLQQPRINDELTAFDSSIDELALYSFDIYMNCREKIYELKANEARDMTFRLLQQAKLIVDNED